MGKLTDVALRNWIRIGLPIAKADGAGLTFTLSAKGTATWVLRYRIGGKAKELTLGRYPDMALSKARVIAAERRVAIQTGIDVAAEKQERKGTARLGGGITVQALYEDFYKRNIVQRRKRPEQVAGVFALHILPKIGNLPVKEVRPSDIDSMLRAISARGVFRTAAKALQLTKSLFNYAMKIHLVVANPATPFNWHDIGGKLGPRSRVLTRDELVRFFKAMRNTPNFQAHSAAAFKLLLALGVRKMELLKARWEEFNLDSSEWHIPAERTKTDAAIRIPLNPWVISILKEQRSRGFNEYVFPMLRLAPGKKTAYMGETTLNHALYSLLSDVEPFTVHDLRRTARTHLAALGVEPHIAEMCLNHKLKGIEATYNVHDYFEERRGALDLLSELLSGCENESSNAVSCC